MPYRIDFRAGGGEEALGRLIELGAIDVEHSADGGIAALMPDAVAPEQIRAALDIAGVAVSDAVGRDEGSVWILSPRSTRVGRLRIVHATREAEPGALRLIDSHAFGTGLHPTTVLCLEAIDEAVAIGPPASILDVGTGNGVLALGALTIGVPRAVGIDIDASAVRAAGENARVNGLEHRFRVVRGGPDALSGSWPLVVANVLAAPLIEMAPVLVQRLGHRGRLVLSGIPSSAEPDVDRAYRHLGLRRLQSTVRAGWVALALQASW